MEWSSGYRTEIQYIPGYFSELNPSWLRLAFLFQGYTPPNIENACELGFGQGISLNFNAATTGINWYGNDFNPSQVANAKKLSSKLIKNVHIYENDFSSFGKLQDLPNFDFICLHGIWSWISDENRAAILDFIDSKLNVGGVVYISYNTLPGLGQIIPLREMLFNHFDKLSGPDEEIDTRIERSKDYVASLIKVSAKFFEVNSDAKKRFDSLANKNSNYLAHEYFNRDWKPMSFGQLSDFLESAKLTYCCSANFLDNVDAINMTEEQIELLSKFKNTVQKETTRDIMYNQGFRRDYWVKGPTSLSKSESQRELNKTSVIMKNDPSTFDYKVKGYQGMASLNENIYKAVLNEIPYGKILKIGEICTKVQKISKFQRSQVLESLYVLFGKGVISPIRDEAQVKENINITKSLNDRILDQAYNNADSSFLVSPLTGMGVAVTRIYKLFMLGRKNGAKTNSDLAKFVWNILSENGEKMLKDGRPAEGNENLELLEDQAENFSTGSEPLFKLLKI